MHRRDMLKAAAASALLLPTSLASKRPAVRPGLIIDSLIVSAAPDFPAETLRAAGMDSGVFDLPIYPRGPAEALQALTAWSEAARAPAAPFRLVLNAADLPAARAAGKFGVILASQDAGIIGPSVFSVSDANLETLRSFHALGLRVLQLTHNERNVVADGFREKNDGGLSLLGEALVKEMNRLGMLVDLSHCSDLTTASAIALSSRPVAVTHAGCRALHPSRRNKSDEAIRALADRGGYFGVYMMTRWLTEADKGSADNVVDHIDRVIRIGGIETPGFGSDQPPLGEPDPQADKVAALAGYQKRNAGLPGADPLHGHVTAADMDRPERMAVLESALRRRGHKSPAIAKILGENFARVFREAVG